MKIIKQYPHQIAGQPEVKSNVSERVFTGKFGQHIKVTRWKGAPLQIEFWIEETTGKRTKYSGFVLEGDEFKEFSKFLGLEVI